MKVTEHIKQSKDTLISFEFLPPLLGTSIQSLYDNIDPLMEFKPPFIDVTYHREEYVYQQREGGFLEKVAIRKRPGTVGICAAIMNRYHIDAIPHIICGGFTKVETENALIDLNYLGIDNVLLIRGDARKNESTFICEPRGNDYAIDLVKQVINMNKGIYLEEELQNGSKTNFCVGIAGYPEKHYEAPNIKSDIKYLFNKVDIGADYIVTQMFYDNKKYFEFTKKCKEAGINVPIIPGLKPITSISQIHSIPKTFHIDIPDDLSDEIEKCKNNKDAMSVGIAWLSMQCKELMNNGVPCLHFYTMGKAEASRKVAEQLL